MLEVEFNSESESDHEAMVRTKQFFIESNVQKTFNAITFFKLHFSIRTIQFTKHSLSAFKTRIMEIINNK